VGDKGAGNPVVGFRRADHGDTPRILSRSPGLLLGSKIRNILGE